MGLELIYWIVKLLAGAVLVGTLASCVTPEDAAVRACTKAGLVPGTPDYAHCVIEVALVYQAQWQASSAANLGVAAQGFQMAAPQPAPVRRPVTCTTTGIYTNCY